MLVTVVVGLLLALMTIHPLQTTGSFAMFMTTAEGMVG